MYSYWGKARPEGGNCAQYHLLPYHSLDVAAVGWRFLETHPSLLSRFSAALGVNAERLKSLLAFLLAVHDIGKFAETFQAMRPDLLAFLQERDVCRFERMRHDSLGYLLWTEVLWPRIEAEGWFAVPDDRRERRQWRQVFEVCLRAVTGHHGQPPKARSLAGGPLLPRNFFAPEDLDAAAEYVWAAAELLLGPHRKASLVDDPKELLGRLKRWSWWLAGFAVLCDWIGSNQDRFAYCSQRMTLADYWQQYALSQADRALAESAVLPAAVAPFLNISGLFPYIAEPTPLQTKAAQLPLQPGPQLFILEDVTGAGKTEAALILVHRLMTAGQADGAYIALPTMATANAMYGRMAGSYQRLFREGSKPSLVLAHGARELVEDFRQSVLPVGGRELDYASGEGTATAQCAAWLADQRKKALLANVGVGTIDQALLAVLYSRHQSLRLFGLLGKVLLVDEVHACDPYVYRLLRTLLAFHAAAGGSAILMSATLPMTMRQGLVEAFCEGGDYEPPELTCKAYPLLTQVGAAGSTEDALPARAEVHRRVEVDWLTQREQAIALIRQAAAEGHCVCWIRNTVADALEARQFLAEYIPADRLHLFHARYPMGDRIAIENRVLKLFGKLSRAEDRAGQVLIATQVVEQSLDLDFDVMITDLAPIDLLLQRAGRLHRHRRDASGNPLPTGSMDGRGHPRLSVLGPQPDDDVDADWYKAAFKGASAVYPDHGQLWLTARLLTERGGFEMPDDARVLIEGVYGEDAQIRVPEPLQQTHFETEAKALSHSSLARQNSLALDEGYETPALDWWDDAATPTRLGDPVSNLRLARWQNGRIVPWAEGPFAWQLSDVSVRQALVAAEAEHAGAGYGGAVEAAKESMPDKGKWSLLVVLERVNGGWIGQAKDSQGRVVSIRYDSDAGLMVGRIVQEA